MHSFSLVAAAALLAAPLVSGYANPGACSGTCNNAHDPSIIRRDDGTYFRFSTGGKIAIHTAPALTGPWTYKCAMLPSGSSINLAGNTDLWAPDVSKVGSQYYVYYSVSTSGSQTSAIGLATSSSMDCNSFTDHGSAGVTSKPGSAYNAIDAHLFLDGSTYYLTFGSFWNDIYQVPMKSTPTAPAGTSVQLAFDPGTTHPDEGSFLVKYGSYYYLFFSHGRCCNLDTSRPAAGEEYKIQVCRSTKPNGGFVDAAGTACTKGQGTTVLPSHGNVYAPGGQGVFNDPVNGWVLYYHYVDTNIGYGDGQKVFGWNKINWSSGWPTV